MDWVTVSSLATAGGTLVLAVATFSSVKSANRSARVAERALLAGLRPVLTPSREDDPAELVRFGDAQTLRLRGHGGAIAVGHDALYLSLGLRNGGTGLAVIHGWRVKPRPSFQATPDGDRGRRDEMPPPEQFRRQQVDLYVPAGGTGFWLGALRDRSEPIYEVVRRAAGGTDDSEGLQIDLLYGDHEGGQRTITRFVLAPWPDADHDREGLRVTAIRYWNLDRDDPR